MDEDEREEICKFCKYCHLLQEFNGKWIYRDVCTYQAEHGKYYEDFCQVVKPDMSCEGFWRREGGEE